MQESEKHHDDAKEAIERDDTQLAIDLARASPEHARDFDLLMDPTKFDQLQRVAKMYASSTIVPDHYRDNVANCAIGLQMAMRLNVDPLPFFQSSYIVHGKPGIESKLAIALLHRSGYAATKITYEITGQGLAKTCTASVVDAKTGEVKAASVSRQMAKDEGWDKDAKTKAGGTIKSKWNTMEDLMLQYRSAMFLIRTQYPEVILGMLSKEELDDMSRAELANGRVARQPDYRHSIEKLRVAGSGDGAPREAKPNAPAHLDGLAEALAACKTKQDIAAVANEYTDRCNTGPELDEMEAIVKAAMDTKG